MKRVRFFSAKNIAMLGILLAFVIALQSVSLVTTIFLATPISLVMIPIVLGGILMGPIAGGILGFMFSLLCIIFGATGVDTFTAYLLAASPFPTVLICLLKGLAAGIVPALLYCVISKKNRYAALVVASLAAPILNTVIFVLGAMCMWGIFEGLAVASGVSVMYFIIVSVCAINFAIEFGSTVVLTPSIYRVSELYLGKKESVKQSTEREQVDENMAENSETETVEKNAQSLLDSKQEES